MARTSTCLLLLLALAGCDRGAPTPASAPVAPSALPESPDNPRIVRTASPMPERYAAALPASSEALEAWLSDDATFPPEAHVADAIAVGDAEMFARLATAAMRVPDGNELAWARGWHDHLARREPGAVFCARARSVVAAPSSTLRLALVGPWALACADAEERELVLRTDTPDWAVLAWYSDTRLPRRAGPMPYDHRLADALRHALEDGDRTRLNEAARTLALQPDPGAAADLLEIHAAISDPKISAEVAGYMRWSRDPRVQAIGAEACRRDARQRGDCDEPFGIGDPWAPEPAPDATPAARGELAATLVIAGFDRVSAGSPHTGLGDATWDLLVAANHAYWFDVETGDYPNHHDSLLRKLASLVQPALDGVVFEEVAPDDEDEEGTYALRAYVDGARLETTAQNLGDWYDVDAVLRLLDAVVVERKSDARFVALATEDQTLTIVGASAGVLTAAIERKLIVPGDPHAAEKLGKQFEERVRGMLETGGKR